MASANPLHPKDSRPIAFRSICRTDFPILPPTGLDHHFRSVADLASCVTPSLKRRTAGTGIFSLFPITYAFRPRLRGRLTLGGRTFPRKPWDYGGKDSHLTFRYSCPHNLFHALHARLPSRFDSHGMLLYHLPLNAVNPQLRQPV